MIKNIWYNFQEHIPKDKPSNPGRPYVIEDTSNSNVFITWQSSDRSTVKYELEVHYIFNFENSSSFENKSWSLVYSDESSQWPISGLNAVRPTSPAITIRREDTGVSGVSRNSIRKQGNLGFPTDQQPTWDFCFTT